MQLSSFTSQVLKNYATINSNIVIRPGNTIMTMSEAKNILSQATVTETFEKEFGIYDLSECLSAMGLVDSPSLRFEESFVRITDGSGRGGVEYFYSDPDMLTSPTKGITMPAADVTFTLDEGTLSGLKRAAGVLGHNELSITPGDGCIKLTIVDSSNTTSNKYSIEVPGEFNSDNNFNFIVGINNLRMIPGSYLVQISSKLISQFTSTDDEKDLKYWVALEKSSTFE
jgi:hypothetical protein